MPCPLISIYKESLIFITDSYWMKRIMNLTNSKFLSHFKHGEVEGNGERLETRLQCFKMAEQHLCHISSLKRIIRSVNFPAVYAIRDCTCNPSICHCQPIQNYNHMPIANIQYHKYNDIIYNLLSIAFRHI